MFVQEEFKSYGLKAPLFEDIQHGFRVVIYSEEEKMSEKMSEKTSEKILSLIQKNKEITIEELAHMTGVSTRSVERNLSKLQRENRITRIGPDKGGSWKVNA
ncbi:winged helix-turn-helix transcriptional regulator [Arcticibacter tournemirensis]|uniref:Winged helix-turn-helix transcriptional regulator n=2 Tax=Arcticibacter tournemirensis TaxID=699437 RepID=A0A4Q0M4Q7_9SPHI|nr:winged helix-turn-helix transcriptional regulator [Arcticibacter tournemirensis]